MELVLFIGPMEENILALGKMENSMEEENTSSFLDKKNLENGFKEKELSGLMNLQTEKATD